MSDVSTESQESLLKNIPEEDYDLNRDGIDLSLLRLDSFNSSTDRRRESSLPPLYSFGRSCAPVRFFTSACAAAATDNSPMKRSSPESDAADEPRRKKMFLQQDGFNSTPLSGYSKISIPSDPFDNPNQIRTPSAPVLRRSLLDTYISPVKYSSGPDHLRRSLFQEKVGAMNQEMLPLACSSMKESGPHSLSPLPRALGRSVSDLTSSPANSFSKCSSHCEMLGCELVKREIPDSKMLLMIKDRMREMNGWCKELLRYGEGLGREELNDAPKAQVMQQEDPEQVIEEGVRVERTREGYVVRFKCPCCKAYEIIFSDRNFYYKLL